MSDKKIHCLTISVDAIDNLIFYCQLYKDIILANNYSKDSYFYKSYNSLRSFLHSLRAQTSNDPDDFYDILLTLNDDWTVKNES